MKNPKAIFQKNVGILADIYQLLVIFLFFSFSCNNTNPVDNNNVRLEYGTMSDIDGNIYKIIKIGNQTWMAENLRVTKYNDGTAITIGDSATWANIYNKNLSTPAYCYYNNMTDADSIKKYGALYNWYVVSPANPKKIAPTGWHVPTDSDWTILEIYLVLNGYNWDGTRDTSKNNKIAKSLAAQTDWATDTAAGTIGNDLAMNNHSGFSALPGGRRTDGGIGGRYDGWGLSGCWWSATEVGRIAHNYELDYRSDHLSWSGYQNCLGYSVRLVKDN